MVMKELDIEDKIQLKTVSIVKGEQLREDFTSLNPHHTVPTMVDREEEDFVLWESRAIMQYFVRKFTPQSALLPSDNKHLASVERCMFLDASALYPSFSAMFFQIIQEGQERPSDRSVRVMKTKLQLLDRELVDKKFAVGDGLTLADFCYLVTLDTLDALNFATQVSIEPFENVYTYVTGLKESLSYYGEVSDEALEKIKQIVQAKIEMASADVCDDWM